MLGPSRTEHKVSEGTSPSTSLVHLQPCERTLSFEEFYEKREEDRQSGFKPPTKKMILILIILPQTLGPQPYMYV